MKATIPFIICFSFLGINSKAQSDTTKLWTKDAVINLSATQVSLTNWAAGGQNAISVNGLINANANYKKDKISWDNNLTIGYGLVNQAKLPWWEKSDDRIDFSSKLGRAATNNWSYTGLLNFKTQMTPGYNASGIRLSDRSIISDLFSPAYLIIALGMDYKPNDNFSVFIAPITGKTTIVANQDLADAGAFGVTGMTLDQNGLPVLGTGENIRNEFGGYLKLNYKVSLMENIGFQTKLELFSNYLNNPLNIDVNWECQLDMKINKYFSATLSTQLLYDHDIRIAHSPDANGINTKFGPTVQFKEVLSIGFSYKL